MSLTEHTKDIYNEFKQLDYFRNKKDKSKEEEWYSVMLEVLNSNGKLKASGTSYVTN